MSLLSRLFLLFIGVPLLELYVLIQLGQLMGVWPTVGLVVLTGVAGASLARREGLRTLWTIQGELSQGKLPGSALLDGLAILTGGALLLTPGILTDFVGFSFLLPPTRRPLLAWIRRSMEKRLRSGSIRIVHVNGTSGGGAGFGSVFREWGGASSEEAGEEPLDRSGEIVIESDEGGSR